MFNLFKSPEDKLKNEMVKNIEKMAFLCLKENGMNGSPIEGMILIKCIKNSEEFFVKRSIDISRKHGLDREKTISIIKDSAKKVHDENIKY